MTNGNLNGEFFYEGTARVECDSGYEGSGPATCQSNGAWATLPTCTAVGKQYMVKSREENICLRGLYEQKRTSSLLINFISDRSRSCMCVSTCCL